ncbi:DUF1501 domain-containing protein [Komagataeibacter sp. AV436]|uniref:DUF1501 domain-containing protein n=1 Tax=Komagataeibacter melomenusus TaxID=2766578 RepID=A0ABX2ABK5_9PROT|nr:DUF1501 domain-containing protein [Komagataeibacter melomenusus]MBV1829758.1 DUF1501 domain-containing protein [Komagataeibacter melomenusus]NPC65042.1 DUF1501 domain-containing protein [Komagataeibacter melomenusus]
MLIRRRAALLGLATSWTLGCASLAMAAPSSHEDDPRLVVIIMRGALDGMSAVTPYGDPDLATHRRALILPPPGTAGGLLDMGGFYGLHPALQNMHALYGAGELLPVHAVAGNYRSRSHFEAQDYLESGADGRMDSGWLNRAVSLMPQRDAGPDGYGLAMGLTVPLLLRGPAEVGCYAPAASHHPDPDLYRQIAALNADDPVTGPALRNALQARGFSDTVMEGSRTAPAAPRKGRRPDAFLALSTAAGRMLANRRGPRIAALEIGGWDTHARQVDRLGRPLAQLDRGLAALRDGLGPAWSRTVVLAMTEFGRTVRINGTGGTDHGTGTVAFIAGGPVAGGRVAGTWPGLRPDQLFENRDLAPTTDLRCVAAGLLCDHMRLEPAGMATVFPGATATPMRGLIRQA